jgi:hypothetical protein
MPKLNDYKDDLNEFIIASLVVAIGWIFFFILSHFIMGSPHDIPAHISFIFIPAGYKLIVSMVLRWRSILGLFLGSVLIIEHYHPTYTVLSALLISSITATTGILAVILVEALSYKEGYLLDIKIEKITLLLLALSYAFVNSLLHNIVFKATGIMMIRLTDPIKMFIGDFFGALIFIGFIQAMLYLLRRQYQSRKNK